MGLYLDHERPEIGVPLPFSLVHPEPVPAQALCRLLVNGPTESPEEPTPVDGLDVDGRDGVTHERSAPFQIL
jgi:hypothetical protein